MTGRKGIASVPVVITVGLARELMAELYNMDVRYYKLCKAKPLKFEVVGTDRKTGERVTKSYMTFRHWIAVLERNLLLTGRYFQ